MEQRSHYRRSISVRAQVHDGVKVTDARIVNMTPMGMKLRTASPPPRGTHVQVRVHDIAANGRVVWSSHSEFGLFVSGENPLFDKCCVVPANSRFTLGNIAIYRDAGASVLHAFANNKTDYLLMVLGFFLLLAMALSEASKWAL